MTPDRIGMKERRERYFRACVKEGSIHLTQLTSLLIMVSIISTNVYA